MHACMHVCINGLYLSIIRMNSSPGMDMDADSSRGMQANW